MNFVVLQQIQPDSYPVPNVCLYSLLFTASNCNESFFDKFNICPVKHKYKSQPSHMVQIITRDNNLDRDWSLLYDLCVQHIHLRILGFLLWSVVAASSNSSIEIGFLRPCFIVSRDDFPCIAEQTAPQNVSLATQLLAFSVNTTHLLNILLSTIAG